MPDVSGRPAPVHWMGAKLEERQKIIRDVGAHLAVIQDGEPPFADAVDDLVETTGDHERLDDSGGISARIRNSPPPSK